MYEYHTNAKAYNVLESKHDNTPRPSKIGNKKYCKIYVIKKLQKNAVIRAR